MDWFQIGKGAHQGRTPSPCLFNAVCVIGNARLEEAQAVSNTVGRNINNLRYADDATFVAEKKKKEELSSLLLNVTEERENVGLKPNIQKLRTCHPVPSLHGK